MSQEALDMIEFEDKEIQILKLCYKYIMSYKFSNDDTNVMCTL